MGSFGTNLLINYNIYTVYIGEFLLNLTPESMFLDSPSILPSYLPWSWI